MFSDFWLTIWMHFFPIYEELVLITNHGLFQEGTSCLCDTWYCPSVFSYPQHILMWNVVNLIFLFLIWVKTHIPVECTDLAIKYLRTFWNIIDDVDVLIIFPLGLQSWPRGPSFIAMCPLCLSYDHVYFGMFYVSRKKWWRPFLVVCLFHDNTDLKWFIVIMSYSIIRVYLLHIMVVSLKTEVLRVP